MGRSLAALALLAFVAVALAARTSSASHRHVFHQPAAAPVVRSAPADRISVSPAEYEEAHAAGILERPVTSILKVPGPMRYGDFVWNERNVPAGPLWVRVDLKAQIISVFRSGQEIGTAVILYGADGVPTPTGKFLILAKLKDHRSAIYDNAPMPYTLRLTHDGVSIHGSNVRWGFATHGCIGVPTAFAAKLFDAASLGDEVTIVSARAKAQPGA